MSFPFSLPLPRVLLVEDDAPFSHYLARSLRKRNYAVEQVPTLQGAETHIHEAEKPYDVILLDATLPDGDALHTLPDLQNLSPASKICFLSGHPSQDQEVSSLQKGADDYLPKPVTYQQVLAHIDVLLRRGKIFWDRVMHFGELRFDPDQRFLQHRSRRIKLSQRETDFMSCFFRGKNGFAHREQLNAIYWQKDQETPDYIIHMSIQRLRKKIAPLNVRIEAIYGIGYRLHVDARAEVPLLRKGLAT